MPCLMQAACVFWDPVKKTCASTGVCLRACASRACCNGRFGFIGHVELSSTAFLFANLARIPSGMHMATFQDLRSCLLCAFLTMFKHAVLQLVLHLCMLLRATAGSALLGLLSSPAPPSCLPTWPTSPQMPGGAASWQSLPSFAATTLAATSRSWCGVLCGWAAKQMLRGCRHMLIRCGAGSEYGDATPAR
jgi:hypothetical protein